MIDQLQLIEKQNQEILAGTKKMIESLRRLKRSLQQEKRIYPRMELSYGGKFKKVV